MYALTAKKSKLKRPNLKQHLKSVMLTGCFIWLSWPNWLNLKSKLAKSILISLSKLRGRTLCFFILSYVQANYGNGGGTVKILPFFIPDICPCRFSGTWRFSVPSPNSAHIFSSLSYPCIIARHAICA